ncbi:MAG: nucleotidyl transferase AbiEii/AbiGii toxin family protein [Saprospiraceae bacterium]|nr:nucleotidyl transferase AbiEii/AbiGii toxin family protein [Saprospiraceae bacterium]
MKKVYLHNHPEFEILIRVLNSETGFEPGLIEKDYWIMHVLYGLKVSGFKFELKGGTSLSKGYNIINRFSEDIDIHIHPPASLELNLNPNNRKQATLEKRKTYYDELANKIKIPGIQEIVRDTEFDTESYLSGGIRLFYQNQFPAALGVKESILLEAGFDKVAPNNKILISSWTYDRAISQIQSEILDNRAIDIPCYHPGYTFVEKLQTIATKFRNEQISGDKNKNLLRQYYDVAMLLQHKTVKEFIGTPQYQEHKKLRFPKTDFDIPIKENEAFLLANQELRDKFKARYESTKSLYYSGQPDFDDLLRIIHSNIERL